MAPPAARATLGALVAVAALAAGCGSTGSSEVVYVTTTTTPAAAGASDGGDGGGGGDGSRAESDPGAGATVTPADGTGSANEVPGRRPRLSEGGAASAGTNSAGANSAGTVDVDSTRYRSPNGDAIGFTVAGGDVQCEIGLGESPASGMWGEEAITGPSGYCLSRTAGPSRENRPSSCSQNITWMPVAGAVSGTRAHLGLCTGGQPFSYADTPPALPPGSRIAAGETACDATDSGVTCRNLSGAVFTITPSNVTLGG